MIDDRDNFAEPLSVAGQQRRREILRIALAAGRRRHQRQHQRKRATIAAILGVAVLVPASIVVRRRALQTPIPESIATSPPAPAAVQPTPMASATAFTVAWLQTDPDIVRKLSVGPPLMPVQILTDDQLLDRLSEIGQPGALASTNGKPRLVLLNSKTAPGGL